MQVLALVMFKPIIAIAGYAQCAIIGQQDPLSMSALSLTDLLIFNLSPKLLIFKYAQM